MGRRKMIVMKFGLPKGMDEDEMLDIIRSAAESNDITARVIRKKPPTHGVPLDVAIMHKLEEIPDPNDGISAWGATQEGLSDSLEIHTSVVSRYLGDLTERRLVNGRTGPIEGLSRRRRAYYLTKRGRQFLESIRSRGG